MRIHTIVAFIHSNLKSLWSRGQGDGRAWAQSHWVVGALGYLPMVRPIYLCTLELSTYLPFLQELLLIETHYHLLYRGYWVNQQNVMRPENSVLCALAFCVPNTFHFHEESLPANHNNHGEPR
jgi:hypothetical protein